MSQKHLMEQDALYKVDINNNLSLLTQNLCNLQQILIRLVSSETISVTECELILNKEDTCSKNWALFETLKKKAWSPSLKALLLEILRETGNNLCADLIEGVSTKAAANNNSKPQRKWENPGKPICHNFSPPVSNFTGRDKELKTIDEGFKIKLEGRLDNVVVISGLGGMGKSQIARKYTVISSPKDPIDISWITAENLDRSTDTLIDLAKTEYNLQATVFTGEEKITFKDAIVAIYHHVVYNYRNAIFIFDNAEDYRREFLPINCSIHPNYYEYLPKILFTTQKSEFVPNNEATELPLGTLTLESAKQLISSSLHKRITIVESDLEELCNILQNFPLALQLAIGHMNYYWRLIENYSIKSYIDEFHSKTKELLNKGFKRQGNMDYEYSITVAWKNTLDKMKLVKHGMEGLKILIACSYLDTEDIDVPMILQLASEGETEIPLEAAHVPFDYSMYTLADGKIIEMHRLVRQVIRIHNEEEGNEHTTLNIILERLYKLSVQKIKLPRIFHLMSAWRYSEKFPDLIINFKYVPAFATKALELNVRYYEARSFSERAILTLKTVLDPIDEHLLNLQFLNGIMNYKLGEYNAALETFETLLKVQVAIPCKESNIWQTKSGIGLVYVDTAEYSKAEQIFAEIFEQAKSSFGIQDEITLGHLNSLASIYKSQGRYKESKEMYNIFFDNCKILSADEGNETCMNAKNNLVLVEKEMGNLDIALKLYNEVIEESKKKFPSKHPMILTTMNNIAALYDLKGDFVKALTIFEECYENWKSVLGEDHPKTLAANNNIGTNYMSQGDYKKSSEIFLDVLTRKEKTLKEDHYSLYISKTSIARLEELQGNYSKSLKMYQDATFQLIKIFGPRHSQTLKARNGVAGLLVHVSEYDRALLMYKKLIEDQSISLGDHHPDILVSKFGMGEVFLKLNKFQAARDCFQEVLDKQKQTLGMYNLKTILTMSRLAVAYQFDGKNAEAEKLWNEVNAKLADFSEECNENPEILNTKAHFAGYYLNSGRHQDALQLFQQVFEIQKRKLGPKHADTIHTKNNICVANLHLKKFPQAAKALEEVVVDIISSYGEDHEKVLQAQTNLALAYKNMQQYEKSLSMYESVYQKKRNNIGEFNVDTALTKYNLAMLYHSLGRVGEATAMIRDVYKVFSTILGENHPMTVQVQKNLR